MRGIDIVSVIAGKISSSHQKYSLAVGSVISNNIQSIQLMTGEEVQAQSRRVVRRVR